MKKGPMIDSTWHDGVLRYVRMLWIPILVVVLILVIRGIDAKRDADKNPTGPKTETTAPAETGPRETAVPETTKAPEKKPDASNAALQQDMIPELTDLVKEYCRAKTEVDVAALASVFGEEWTTEEQTKQQEHMELVKASVKAYENITCYHVEGLKEGEFAIFPAYEIHYRKSDIRVPEISFGYVVKKDGKYVMVEKLSKDQEAYIRSAVEKPEMQHVIAMIRMRQKEALEADETLAWIYNGSQGSQVVVGERTKEQ